MQDCQDQRVPIFVAGCSSLSVVCVHVVPGVDRSGLHTAGSSHWLALAQHSPTHRSLSRKSSFRSVYLFEDTHTDKHTHWFMPLLGTRILGFLNTLPDPKHNHYWSNPTPHLSLTLQPMIWKNSFISIWWLTKVVFGLKPFQKVGCSQKLMGTLA